VSLPGVCLTADGPEPITAVWDDQGRQIDVCRACLEARLDEGQWVPGERGWFSPPAPPEDWSCCGSKAS